MSDIEKVLELLEVKRSHLAVFPFLYAYSNPDDDARLRQIRKTIYEAQSAVLKQFAKEIRASMPSPEKKSSSEVGQANDFRWYFVTEVGGHTTAWLYDELEEVKALAERFETKHQSLIEWGEVSCHIGGVVIPPNDEVRSEEAAQRSVLDVRHAFITDIQGTYSVTICNTQAELEAGIADFKMEYEDLIESNEAVCTSHAIAIPFR